MDVSGWVVILAPSMGVETEEREQGESRGMITTGPENWVCHLYPTLSWIEFSFMHPIQVQEWVGNAC